MTNKLHPIRHDLPTILWCGPAALSVTTGYPTSVIVRTLKRITGRRRITGVNNGALSLAAKQLGYQLVSVYDWAAENPKSRPPTLKPTLAKFLRTHREQVRGQHPIIVNVTGHYVTVHGRSFIDNHTKAPVALGNAPHRRKRVKRAWKVVPLPYALLTNGGI